MPGTMSETASGGLEIRRMQFTDLAQVIDIERLSFQSPWSEGMFLEELRNPASHCMVASKEGRPVGYICSMSVIDEGHILDIAVHPAFRRQGIATSLVENTIDDLLGRGCRRIFLEVRSSNETAQKMYLKLGFEVIARRKGYYSSPIEDAVVMAFEAGDE